jgi:serine/threonine protein kinase
MEMARAMIYLHSRRPTVIHRDIKPANFLVDRAWRVKVCDFGLASNTKKQVGAGTPAYMAPELFSSSPYNEKVDVYAFGIVLNEMDTRKMPYTGMGVAEIKASVLSGQRPEVSLSCPKLMADIIKKCWDQDAAERPSFVAVLDMLKDANKAEA